MSSSHSSDQADHGPANQLPDDPVRRAAQELRPGDPMVVGMVKSSFQFVAFPLVAAQFAGRAVYQI